ncbi:MAG: prepilin-type N-terminal cleavage/methylation domain-containing protein [Candidatus Pacebacteria bacterium]|nr:prepilin-type N-terminal cleavage/methylation domain-containing protein [Candidatus Paceibacterota bacterium]
MTKKQITNNKGFTMVEIMVVIGIIIVLAGISWAAFHNYQPTMELNAVLRNLTSDLRLAQQLSVTEQVNHGIFFDLSNKSYSLLKFSDPVQTLFSKNLPASISISDIVGLSNETAIFNPYGSSIEPGSLVLSNTSGQTRTI